MPPFVPFPDSAQAELVFSLGGKVVMNRLWFTLRTPPITQVALDALAIGLYSWHATDIMPHLSSDLTLLGVGAQDWNSFPPPFTSSQGTPIAGGNTSGSHSANVAIRVLFKGDNSQTFPSNSNFIPGIPLDAVNLNRYTTAIRNVIFDAYVRLTDLTFHFGVHPGWRWNITSRQLNNAWRTTQDFARTDHIRFPSPYVSPRRRRLPR